MRDEQEQRICASVKFLYPDIIGGMGLIGHFAGKMAIRPANASIRHQRLLITSEVNKSESPEPSSTTGVHALGNVRQANGRNNREKCLS